MANNGPVLEYGVVDDYGDDWETGYLIFTDSNLDRVYEWAEQENYHSASIVKIFANGKRKQIK